WKLAALEIGGKAGDLPERPVWWVIQGNKVYYGGTELATIKVDSTTTPKCIDLAFREPKKVLEGVYAIDGETLKLCVNRQADGVRERPTGFATNDKPEWRLLVFKRDKVRKTTDVTGLGGFVGMQIMSVQEPKQLVITAVIAGSPAKKAGLQKDD